MIDILILLFMFVSGIVWIRYPQIRMELLVAKIVQEMIVNNQAYTTFVIKKQDLSQMRIYLAKLEYVVVVKHREKNRLHIAVFHQ